MSFWADRSIFAKIVLVLALVFLCGVGLCGLDFALAARGIGKSTQEFGVGPLDAVSLAAMALSALALLLTLGVWICVAIVKGIKGQSKEP
ncbi:MAG TPA: hypothetical protein VG267_17535 [Terracidiphilus sp.]|jgi:hypothetical protein|nr:hypothetical protein [Terracidiphilus sp.]